ncbi:hypothetical protein RchiOBHm_Chr1g0382261 [Rosa chinensis]|uniref:C-JID domain-containing protein n=1 Tax=Rosa chinensis TaxID=74649 RepID=A0A2P6SPC6_ROSCH|nr:hypothetical protein RchiOBHm_Chr1g0382261 [Rosa chinensis]
MVQGTSYFHDLRFIIPGSEIPEWFNNQSVGNSVTEKVPWDAYNSKWIGFAVCALIVLPDNPSAVPDTFGIDCRGTRCGTCILGIASDRNQFVSDHLYLVVLPGPFRHPWMRVEDTRDEVERIRNEVKFDFNIRQDVGKCMQIKKCGARAFYQHDVDELISKMNQSKSSISLYEAMDEQEGAMVKATQEAATSRSGCSDDDYYSAEE